MARMVCLKAKPTAFSLERGLVLRDGCAELCEVPYLDVDQCWPSRIGNAAFLFSFFSVCCSCVSILIVFLLAQQYSMLAIGQYPHIIDLWKI